MKKGRMSWQSNKGGRMNRECGFLGKLNDRRNHREAAYEARGAWNWDRKSRITKPGFADRRFRIHKPRFSPRSWHDDMFSVGDAKTSFVPVFSNQQRFHNQSIPGGNTHSKPGFHLTNPPRVRLRFMHSRNLHQLDYPWFQVACSSGGELTSPFLT